MGTPEFKEQLESSLAQVQGINFIAEGPENWQHPINQNKDESELGWTS